MRRAISPVSFGAVLAFVLAAGCRREPPSPIADAGSPSVAVTAAASTTPSSALAPDASVDASVDVGQDFEDQFVYGSHDAGRGDPALLGTKPGYVPYANARFGFSLDVPRALTAMPEPTNGEGLQWRLGDRSAMTASGMHALDDLPPTCASSRNVTAHTTSANGCWATGKRDGFIFWERVVVAHGTMYSLRMQYAESLKAQMDPVVLHVNASWKF